MRREPTQGPRRGREGGCALFYQISHLLAQRLHLPLRKLLAFVELLYPLVDFFRERLFVHFCVLFLGRGGGGGVAAVPRPTR